MPKPASTPNIISEGAERAGIGAELEGRKKRVYTKAARMYCEDLGGPRVGREVRTGRLKPAVPHISKYPEWEDVQKGNISTSFL